MILKECLVLAWDLTGWDGVYAREGHDTLV